MFYYIEEYSWSYLKKVKHTRLDFKNRDFHCRAIVKISGDTREASGAGRHHPADGRGRCAGLRGW